MTQKPAVGTLCTRPWKQHVPALVITVEETELWAMQKAEDFAEFNPAVAAVLSDSQIILLNISSLDAVELQE